MANETLKVDALVIGAGPGGYPCGIRLGQLKKKVLVVERDKPGGVCLNVGCIPSKALINAAKLYDKMRHAADIGIEVQGVSVDMKKMQTWKDEVVGKLTGGVKQLLKANGADYKTGDARLTGRNTAEITTKDGKVSVEAGSIVVATGSRPIEIPGFKFDGKRVLDSTGGLALTEVPARLLVIGAGYIGLEIGTMLAKLGSKVTVVEALGSILPGQDQELAAVVARKLKKSGVEMILGAKAKGWTEKGGKAVVTIETDKGEAALDADKILVAVGRRPNSENLGLEALGVKTERGFVVTDKKCRTSVPGIYAIGDVAGQPMLAHKATKEGEVVAEIIAGHDDAEMDVRAIPAVIFTDPEVAYAGVTAEEAEKKGRKIKVGKFPFAALGRAIANHDTDGFVKCVIDADTKEILGIGAVGNGACDVIAEATLAIEMGALADDIGLTVHAHPTLPEAIMEAAKAATGEAIHIVNR